MGQRFYHFAAALAAILSLVFQIAALALAVLWDGPLTPVLLLLIATVLVLTRLGPPSDGAAAGEGGAAYAA